MLRDSFVKSAAASLAAALVLGACGGESDPTPPEQGPGAISGTVREAGGAGIAGVTVTLGGAATRTATTSSTGGYQFGDLAAGQYTVSVEAPAGFTAPGAKPVSLAAGANVTVNFDLEAEGVKIVNLQGTSFSPADLTIAKGTTVRWVNKDGVFHTVTPDGHSEWGSASLNQTDQIFEHTFDTAGTFPYYCQPHQSAGMTGKVTVQ